MTGARTRRLARTLLPALAAAALVCPGLARPAAGPASLAVVVALEPAGIRIGDTARLTVVVDHPATGSVSLPTLDRGKEIVAGSRSQKTEPLKGAPAGTRVRTTVTVALTSFAPGDHAVGSGAIIFTSTGGGTQQIPFPPAVLRTRSVLQGQEMPMRQAKGLAGWPAPSRRRVGLGAGLIALLAVAAVLWIRLRRAPGRAATAGPPVKPAAPHDTALKALAALAAKGLAEKGQVELFHRELSAIVRRYVEERFGLRAPELTTEELVRAAASSELLPPARRQTVRDFLEQCDLVKFARHRPGPEDTARAFEAARRLVRETAQGGGP